MTMHATLQGMTDSKGGRRRATYEDVLNAPEHMVAEIIDEVLYLSPRPAFPHALATTELATDLVAPLRKLRGGPDGWWIVVEPELHFGKDVLVPDIAGWRQSRMPNAPTAAFITLAPDWLCETLSPSTEKLDRTKKLRVYARERVPHVWLVSARRKTLEVLKLHGSDWVTEATYRGHDRFRVEPFDAIDIDLAVLWGEPAGPSNEAAARSSGPQR
jgi:Uma2 family endonuclease